MTLWNTIWPYDHLDSFQKSDRLVCFCVTIDDQLLPNTQSSSLM